MKERGSNFPSPQILGQGRNDVRVFKADVPLRDGRQSSLDPFQKSRAGETRVPVHPCLFIIAVDGASLRLDQMSAIGGKADIVSTSRNVR
jgi:hypothetical protein